MSEKSHVSMEQHVCFVCGEVYDTGAILLDKRLRQSMGQHTVTGQGICKEHQSKIDEGYIILIECTIEDAITGHGTHKERRRRTGNIAFVKNGAFKNIFNTDAPPKSIAFVEEGVIEKLSAMTVEGERETT